MDCKKLPPFIIFNGKPGGHIIREFGVPANGYPQGQHYTVQESAWVDCRVMNEWINWVWAPFCNADADGDGAESSYLVMDECRAHTTSQVVRAIQQLGTEVEIIPPGMTSYLQVLDKGINKPFKQYTKEAYERWMIANEDGAKVRRVDVARWIAESWNLITEQTIRNTWDSIGLKGWVGQEGPV
jgi:hypothetical protein